MSGLVEHAYCVEEFLRKVTHWEGSAEDELAEAIESAEKLCGGLDPQPSSNEEKLREALGEARAHLLTYLQGESGLPFEKPDVACRKAVEAIDKQMEQP